MGDGRVDITLVSTTNLSHPFWRTANSMMTLHDPTLLFGKLFNLLIEK
jgi:hypothetical protein